MAQRRLKVLLFAEAVTLAHVARPIALARALDPARYQVAIACAPRYAAFTAGPGWQQLELHSIPSEQFGQALAQGAPLYDLATLEAYVAADLAAIRSTGPDVVVGDFRLSLSVSARLAKLPYLAIANAYWSPCSDAPFPLPVLPITRRLPLALAAPLFSAFRPLAFAMHCRPMNRLRARHGLPSLGSNLRRVYTDADHLLVPDIEALYPLRGPAESYSYVGPLSWSPPVAWPAALDQPPEDQRPTVYVTLGSSGPRQALAVVLDALDGLPLRVLASTAGAPHPARVPANALLADYLPGDRAAACSQLVVCNGGSLAVQQALASGVPVLGLASNMDQFFNMAPVVASGAGRMLRTDRLSAAAVRQACEALLGSSAARAAAKRLQPLLVTGQTPGEVFDAVLQRLLDPVNASAGGRSKVPNTQ